MTAPDTATPQQRRAFLRILAGYAPGQTLSANDLHDDAHLAAQLPPNALGGLWRGAAEAGYVFRVGFTRATDPAARGRFICQWERTTRPVPVEVGA